MPLTFSRQDYTELWIKIVSNESLGILDSDYVEDYFGVDGQLTLLEISSGTRIPIPMTEDLDTSPTIPHDVFVGMIDLTVLADGLYRVEGRVRDVLGNYRILSEVQTPLGGEDVTVFEILITPAEVVIRLPKTAQIVEAFATFNHSIVAVDGKLGMDLQIVGKAFAVDSRNYNFDAELQLESGYFNTSVEEEPSIEATIIDVYSVT
jgi:hypothetical protein